MTNFDKPTTRVTTDAYRVLYSGKSREIVVTLKRMGGDDMLEFREKGSRARFLLSVEDAFRSAVKRKALSELLEKARKVKERKAARRRR